MKFALQIYGVFRTFDVCLPQILNYIMFNQLDYDVFVLSQKADGYTPENEKKIRAMFGNHQVIWKYIEDYPDNIHQYEDQLCENYRKCVDQARKTIQDDLVTNDFVTRLWYRRWLINQVRNDYEKEHHIKYDWVIRTRFDIGYKTIINHLKLTFLTKPPKTKTIYMFPDIFSCGSPQSIDYESDLINHWPYIYSIYVQTNKMANMSNSHVMVSKWLFMSEMNLIQYMSASPYEIVQIPQELKIMRREMIDGLSNTDIKNDHITHVFYGCDDKWIDITNKFIKLYTEQYNNHNNGALLTIDNSIGGYDPVPGKIKNMVITTVENNEYIYREGTKFLFKYQYFYPNMCEPREIKKVTYGLGNKIIDITGILFGLLRKRMNIIFVSNELANHDPCPGEEKILSIATYSGACYEFCEYAIIEFK